MQEIERCAQIAADEAERLRAFGAFIAALRVRWAKILRKEWGMKHGAWEVTRDIALGKAQARIRALEAEKASLLRMVEAKNQLLHAHRIGSPTLAAKALDKIAAITYEQPAEEKARK